MRTPVLKNVAVINPVDWGSRESLSQAAAAAKRLWSSDGAVDSDGDVDPVQLYFRLYEKHFARRANPKSAKRVGEVMRRVLRYCSDQRYDLSTYVDAQMHGVRGYVDRLPYGFQPNMLLGRQALVRYSLHAHAVTKRFGVVAAQEPLFNWLTPRGKRYEQVLLAEMALGEEVLAHARCTGNVTLDVARSLSREQRACVEHVRRPLYVAARLEAAVNVANALRPGLADSIGHCPPFDWLAFVRFLLTQFPEAKKRAACVGLCDFSAHVLDSAVRSR